MTGPEWNPYLVLGVMRDVSPAELDHAARNLVARYEGEQAQGFAGATERLAAVHAAYRRLAGQAGQAIPATPLVELAAAAPAPGRPTWAPPQAQYEEPESGLVWQPVAVVVTGAIAALAALQLVWDFVAPPPNGKDAFLDVIFPHAVIVTPIAFLAAFVSFVIGRERVAAARRLRAMDARGDSATNRTKFEALAEGDGLTQIGLWAGRVGAVVVLGFWIAWRARLLGWLYLALHS